MSREKYVLVIPLRHSDFTTHYDISDCDVLICVNSYQCATVFDGIIWLSEEYKNVDSWHFIPKPNPKTGEKFTLVVPKWMKELVDEVIRNNPQLLNNPPKETLIFFIPLESKNIQIFLEKNLPIKRHTWCTGSL